MHKAPNTTLAGLKFPGTMQGCGKGSPSRTPLFLAMLACMGLNLAMQLAITCASVKSNMFKVEVGCWQNANVGGYTSRGFVEVLAASQSPSSSKWFQGTADAVRQYLWLFENAMRDGVEDFLILSGDTPLC